MYTFEILFRTGYAANDEFVDAVFSLLSALYKNGQISAPTWPMATVSGGMKAFFLAPAVDAFDERYNNRYVQDAVAHLRTKFNATFEPVQVGRDPESNTECVCAERSGYVLFTHYLTIESPLRCLDCFSPVPLYQAPPSRDVEYYDVLSWAGDFKSCDTLQMHTAVGERFGEYQLSQPESALSKQGREICRRLATGLGKPVFYYLHKARGRSATSERERRCPACDREWLLEKPLFDRFDFRCDNCLLLSNVASSVRIVGAG